MIPLTTFQELAERYDTRLSVMIAIAASAPMASAIMANAKVQDLLATEMAGVKYPTIIVLKNAAAILGGDNMVMPIYTESQQYAIQKTDEFWTDGANAQVMLWAFAHSYEEQQKFKTEILQP